MPCNIGYKSFSRARIPEPTPFVVKTQIQAPKVDTELLARLGQEDPQFVSWMETLEILPFYQYTLQGALAAVGNTSPVSFAVDASGLTATATCKTAAERDQAERIAASVGRRWQAELFAAIAELLDFQACISATTEDGAEVIRVEGEKNGNEPVHEYLRVTLDAKRGATVLFEHFSSKERIAEVRSKFLAIAQKFGISITLSDTHEDGSPIPTGVVHRHFLKSGK